MHTLKTIYRTCECGHMNKMYEANTIHQRISWCPVCKDISIKHGFSFRKHSTENMFSYDWQKETFEKFAIAWGG